MPLRNRPGMIVDVHTRIWDSPQQLGDIVTQQLRRHRHTPWQRPNASISAHAEAMHPVTAAIVLGFEAVALQAAIPPEDVARYVSHAPDHSIGFAGIDPSAGSVKQKLDRAQALGLEGVTISPAAQGYHPADSRAMKLYEACEQRQLPILFESGMLLSRQAKMEFDQPHLLDEVARTFPDLKIIITSLGDPWIEQGLALVAKHPTVYADLSEIALRPWQLYNALLRAYQRGVIDQIVFGSNFPFMAPEQAIITIYSVNTLIQGTHLPSVPREQLRSIIERDTLARLGLRPRGSQDESRKAPSAAPESAQSAEAPMIEETSGEA